VYPHQAERLTAALEATGADALVATGAANVAYITGFRSAAQAVDPSTEVYAVFTRSGTALVAPADEAAAVVVEGAEAGHVACYGRFHVDAATVRDADGRRIAALVAEATATPADALARVLGALGVGAGRIVLEAARLPATVAGALGARIAGLTVSGDGSAVLAGARAVKSPYEIESVQQALGIAEEGLDAVLGVLRPGVTEREAAAVWEQEVRRRGGTPFCTILAFGARAAVPTARPGDRPLRPRDLARFEVGCALRGLHASVARMAVWGEPDAGQQTLVGGVLGALEGALDAIRPGVRGDDVLEAALKAGHDAGLAAFDRHRVGHGVGLEPREAPWLERGGAPLEAGMVLAVETPHYVVGEAGVTIMETVLVTRTGAHGLNRSHRGLVTLD
jgi:Xaa-Pro aminopeptidase